MNKIIITSFLTVIPLLGGAGAVLWTRYKDITASPPDKIKILSIRLTEQIRLAILKLASGLRIQTDDVEVIFCAE